MRTCFFNSGLRGELMQRTHTVQSWTLIIKIIRYRLASNLWRSTQHRQSADVKSVWANISFKNNTMLNACIYFQNKLLI